ncbi:MAG: tRNA (adenosine(37)-N6)-dimethylallyltransferase MiaA [Clostridia bacterium]|nr:tRNA (adenosine(37)-N6)-dimethylallyltransferase MiaA [Clostridia bacterium]
MPKLIVIGGPTASGKTALAVEIAKKLNSEVISADSLLVYRDLNIGTAKPSEEEMQGVTHRMIDVVSPTEEFSVSDYERGAMPHIERLLSEGKSPVICGGTGFYLNALLYKSGFGGAPANEEIRQKYELFAEERGLDALHEKLREMDPESASILHPKDKKRVIRAIEIFETTGKKKSDQRDERIERFSFEAFTVDYPREVLYDRINRRVDLMFEAGLVEEVQSLLANGVSESSQCMQGIGYKEVVEGLKTECDMNTVSDVIKQRTRNYAKRQITFFKRMDHYHYLSPDSDQIGEIMRLL